MKRSAVHLVGRQTARRDLSGSVLYERPMATAFSFRLIANDGAARTGEIATAHGMVRTPTFMPVGTQATVKGVHHDDVRASGADIILGNTYHLMLRPGAERIAALGGLHDFMRWPLPILTDSGGYQVMSLSALRKVTEEGVTFRSHIDGAMVELSPERAIEVQMLLGSDIAMQLDECVSLPSEPDEIERAMQLSLRWAERCKRAFELAPKDRALFGIVQGGDDQKLREASARALVDLGFDGYAIGGLAVGQAALFDGRRHAFGSPRSGGARHRHVRLRAADTQWPPWARIYAFWPDQHQKRSSRRRSAATRSRKPLPRSAGFLARIPASPF